MSRTGNPPAFLARAALPNCLRRGGRLAISAAVFAAPAKVFACAACYGASIDSPMTAGMNWAIFTLGMVIATVLGAFLTFLIYAMRKSEAVEAARQETMRQKSAAAAAAPLPVADILNLPKIKPNSENLNSHDRMVRP